MARVKTNKVVYPFHIETFKNYTWDKFEKDFPKDKVYSNFIDFGESDIKYKVSLEFIKKDKEVMYFSLIKRLTSNITVMDEKDKKDEKSYLPATKRVKQHSLFAFYKKHNILLALFNYDGFNKIIPTLKYYLETKLSVEMLAKPLTYKYSEDEISKKIKRVKHIHLISANESYETFERDNKSLTPAKRLKKYNSKREEIVKFQRMGGFEPSEIMKILKNNNYSNYDKVIIDDTNIGEVDILQDQYREFPCSINIDSDGLSIENDFIKEINRIVIEQKDLFSKYS